MERFALRCAIERLRNGLLDSVAVNLLTVEEDRIKIQFSKGLKALEKGQSDHLCICGSYGQGKSHTLAYLNQLSLSQGYATSIVQLDIREIPFHQFSAVYQSMMEKIVLPDGKKFINAWKTWAEKGSLGFLESMPHRFKMVLIAMLCKNKQLSSKESSMKKHQNYRPKEHGEWLEKALMGHNIPLAQLKSIFKYREVEGYKEQSLISRGNDPYFQMIQSLGKVLKEMGYKGLLLFFDEGESMGQLRLGYRAKCYHILDQFFQTKSSVFPIFAFTNDFFEKVMNETYDDVKETFPKNYAEAWQNLNILHLRDLTAQGWDGLLNRLLQLYSQAYHIDLPQPLKLNLQTFLEKLGTQETRFKLKALVNKLDIETQHFFLNN